MTELRKRGQVTWGSVLMGFVGETLPTLLNDFQEGQEAEALEALAKAYREHRTAQMVDRKEEILEGRASVDARLNERKAQAKKP
jgi:hypothetical protein